MCGGGNKDRITLDYLHESTTRGQASYWLLTHLAELNWQETKDYGFQNQQLEAENQVNIVQTVKVLRGEKVKDINEEKKHMTISVRCKYWHAEVVCVLKIKQSMQTNSM